MKEKIPRNNALSMEKEGKGSGEVIVEEICRPTLDMHMMHFRKLLSTR
jgi:hypothetical protein